MEHDIAKLVVTGIMTLRKRGMGDRAIARATGLSHVTILKWASGEGSPTAKNAQKFLDRLSCLLGAMQMAEIMVGKTGESIQTEDVEKHVLALIRALRILNRNDERSVKLLQEINFLSLPEQGETSDEVKKIKKQPVLSQKDEGEQ